MSDKKQPKMSLKTPSLDEKARQAFIEEPEKKIKPPTEQDLPWEKQEVNPEVIKPFNLRFRQPDKLKAEWIVANSLKYKSFHDFCMQAIFEQIEKELSEMLE